MSLKKAVLVIDVQNALCSGEGATYRAKEIISNINDVTFKAREVNVPVIFVQHETKDGAFTKGSEGWKLPKELNRDASDIIIVKTASDAFKDTDLETRLGSLEINHLIICGMQSEYCVDSTIRRALSLDYSITVVADGHTTVDNEVLSASKISKHHNFTWENITSYDVRAKVIHAKQIKFQI